MLLRLKDTQNFFFWGGSLLFREEGVGGGEAPITALHFYLTDGTCTFYVGAMILVA